MRIKAQAESDSFTEACGTQESDIKEEIDGVVGLFKNVLSSSKADAVALRDGGYLYMKANTSTRAVNEARIESAVDAITLTQLKRVAADLETATLSAVLCVCLEENLEDECISVSYAPHVAKRRPAQLSESARCANASRSVEDAVTRYRQLKASLNTLRKHRSGGRKRVNDVKQRTEPLLLAHMQEHSAKRQRVEVVPVAPPPETAPDSGASPAPPLPPLPVILPEHAEAPAGAASAVVAEPVTLVMPDCPPKTYQIRRSTYKSRGKAPGLRVFAESLPECVAPIAPGGRATEAALRQWVTDEAKASLTAVVVTHYAAKVAASKGLPVEKLAVQSVE